MKATVGVKTRSETWPCLRHYQNIRDRSVNNWPYPRYCQNWDLPHPMWEATGYQLFALFNFMSRRKNKEEIQCSTISRKRRRPGTQSVWKERNEEMKRRDSARCRVWEVELFQVVFRRAWEAELRGERSSEAWAVRGKAQLRGDLGFLKGKRREVSGTREKERERNLRKKWK